MNLEKTSACSSYVDVIDRVLDKGIVIDAWMSVALSGIDLITIEARLIVTTIHTYLTHRVAFDGNDPLVRGLRPFEAD
jgi:hypothetical protein